MQFHSPVHPNLNTATDPFLEALNSHSVVTLWSFNISKEKESEKLTYSNESIYSLSNYGKALQTPNFHEAAEVIDTYKSKPTLS